VIDNNNKRPKGPAGLASQPAHQIGPSIKSAWWVGVRSSIPVSACHRPCALRAATGQDGAQSLTCAPTRPPLHRRYLRWEGTRSIPKSPHAIADRSTLPTPMYTYTHTHTHSICKMGGRGNGSGHCCACWALSKSHVAGKNWAAQCSRRRPQCVDSDGMACPGPCPSIRGWQRPAQWNGWLDRPLEGSWDWWRTGMGTCTQYTV
jgi:hypothetical protein